MAMKKLSSASSAASQATITNGVARGCGRKKPGGRAERFVVSFATHEAPTKLPELSVVAPAGVQVAAEPRLTPPLRNCTLPVGPWVELLCEETVAVRVMLPPVLMMLALGTTAVVVVAWVMVTESVLLADAGAK